MVLFCEFCQISKSFYLILYSSGNFSKICTKSTQYIPSHFEVISKRRHFHSWWKTLKNLSVCLLLKSSKQKTSRYLFWFTSSSINQKTGCQNRALLMVEKSGNQTKLWKVFHFDNFDNKCYLSLSQDWHTWIRLLFKHQELGRLCFVHACWHLHFSWNNSHSYFTHRRKIKEVEWWYGGLKAEFISGKFIGLYKSLSVR